MPLSRKASDCPGSKEFLETLELCSRHGTEAVALAVQRALSHPEVCLGLLRYFLAEEKEKSEEPIPSFRYAGPPVMEVSTKWYEELCSGEKGTCQESTRVVRVDPGASSRVESTGTPEIGLIEAETSDRVLVEVSHG